MRSKRRSLEPVWAFLIYVGIQTSSVVWTNLNIADGSSFRDSDLACIEYRLRQKKAVFCGSVAIRWSTRWKLKVPFCWYDQQRIKEVYRSRWHQRQARYIDADSLKGMSANNPLKSYKLKLCTMRSVSAERNGHKIQWLNHVVVAKPYRNNECLNRPSELDQKGSRVRELHSYA